MNSHGEDGIPETRFTPEERRELVELGYSVERGGPHGQPYTLRGGVAPHGSTWPAKSYNDAWEMAAQKRSEASERNLAYVTNQAASLRQCGGNAMAKINSAFDDAYAHPVDVSVAAGRDAEGNPVALNGDEFSIPIAFAAHRAAEAVSELVATIQAAQQPEDPDIIQQEPA